jgi:hypothetical protein
MSLATIMLDHLAVARRAVEDGSKLVPMWRIETPEGNFLISTLFDSDQPEPRERALFAISRFMAWKVATSFVLTTQTWLGAELNQASDEALLTVGVSHHERLAVLQRIKRDDAVSFSQPMWVASYHVDERYLKMLPGRRTEVIEEEAAELSRTFGKNGELSVKRIS